MNSVRARLLNIAAKNYAQGSPFRGDLLLKRLSPSLTAGLKYNGKAVSVERRKRESEAKSSSISSLRSEV